MRSDHELEEQCIRVLTAPLVDPPDPDLVDIDTLISVLIRLGVQNMPWVEIKKLSGHTPKRWEYSGHDISNGRRAYWQLR